MNSQLRHLSILLIVYSLALSLYGQVYYDATQFSIINKVRDSTATPYHRLPLYMKDSLRASHWSLATHSAGLAIRFCTSSKQISAKWVVTYDRSMDHQAAIGTKGIDLYTLNDKGCWQYVNAGRVKGKSSTATLVSNLKGEIREYMLYLPLYDGVDTLQIGVDTTAVISRPRLHTPRSEKPVVMYGTSITQGGCASRPGMAYTNIISRMIGREVINMGYSGNGQLDPEMARYLATLDVSLFVLDFIPNCTLQQVTERTLQFIAILREKHPQTPIILIENAIYPFSLVDQYQSGYQPSKNAMLLRHYRELIGQGDKHLHYINSDNLIGSDQEGTVDSIHFTDLGFMRFAQKVTPIIKRFL